MARVPVAITTGQPKRVARMSGANSTEKRDLEPSSLCANLLGVMGAGGSSRVHVTGPEGLCWKEHVMVETAQDRG